MNAEVGMRNAEMRTRSLEWENMNAELRTRS